MDQEEVFQRHGRISYKESCREEGQTETLPQGEAEFPSGEVNQACSSFLQLLRKSTDSLTFGKRWLSPEDAGSLGTMSLITAWPV
jgi:hypothetical protein